MTRPNEHDDMRLVRRLLNREEAAFEEFFEAMYPALYRFALARLSGQREAAEDVAQTTLYRAIGKLKTYRGEASLLTWLCTFSRHEIFAYAKAHRHVIRSSLLTMRRKSGRRSNRCVPSTAPILISPSIASSSPP